MKKPWTDPEHPLLVTGMIWRIHDLITATATRVYEPKFGLKNAEIRILSVLSIEKNISISDIARQTHIDQAWISRSVKNLINSGIVAKIPDPTDSRATLVSMTSQGRKLYARVYKVMEERENILLQGLSRNDVHKILDKLMDGAEKLYEHSSRQR